MRCGTTGVSSCKIASSSRSHRISAFPTLVLALLILTVVEAAAFPTWMGVYGSFQRHNGSNPGKFTILMNQDYWGLRAKVVIRVNGGAWSAHEMTYVGNVNGNSKYEFTPSWEFPATQIVEFYFHGWDNWGGNIWDSNYGQNYWFPAGHNGRVQWVGNTYHWPFNGAISSNDNLWVNIQSWPSGAAKEGRIVYTADRGLTWSSKPLSFNGVSGNNDAWNVNVGRFQAAKSVRYAIEITDWAGAKHWANNGGLDYYAQVNYGSGLDEDGDGMPNGWEIARGFDPTDPIDADDDKDNDELSNLGEYTAGSDPCVADTDGDGLEDSIEAIGTLTSTTNSQSHTIVTVLSIQGSRGTNVLGAWQPLGSAIVAATNRGTLQFALQVPATDVYFLEISGANTPYRGVHSSADLDIYVGSTFVKRVTLPATTNSASVRCVLPMLTSGAHQVKLSWDGVWKYARLRIDCLKLHALAGADTDADGIKDWVENWSLARNGADLLPMSSAVSPAFIEGRAAYPGLTTISDGIAAKNGAGRRWYANIPLSPTHATPVGVTHENGAISESGSIVWRPTNILVDDGLAIREGDSLLLTAHPLGAAAGEVIVAVQGQGAYTTTVETPIPLRFVQAGSYILSGTYTVNSQSYSDSITVAVVRASFPNSPAAWVQRVRTWTCSNIVGGVKVQMDPSIRFVDAGAAGNGRRFNMRAEVTRPSYAVARLSSGAIIDSTPIKAFRLHSSGAVSIEIVQTYSDGTQRIETGLIQSPVVSDATLDMEIYAGGVTFDDGTLYRRVNASGLDSLGQTAIGFLRAPGVQNSVCHRLRIYQGDEFVGER